MDSTKTSCQQHVQRWQEYWDKGLQSVSSEAQKQLAQELCSSTGLTYKQVQVFIVNVKEINIACITYYCHILLLNIYMGLNISIKFLSAFN